ncbi:amino acid adenylation domain-containing protein [Nocardia sp. NPDC055029]
MTSTEFAGSDLSALQREIWLRQYLHPEPAIAIAQYVDITGDFGIAVLRQALELAGREFGSLRAGFLPPEEGQVFPRAVTRPTTTYRLREFDLRDDDDPIAAAEQLMRRAVDAPLDVSIHPPIEMAAIRVGAARWFWFMRAHHIVLDGYSGMTVLGRTAELYRSIACGTPVEVEPRDDLAVLLKAEQTYRGSRAWERDRRYWRERAEALRGASSSLPVVGSVAAGTTRAVAEFPAAAVPTREEAADRGVVLFSTESALVSVIALYLASVSGEPAFRLSIPVTTRMTKDTKLASGAVSNVVPVLVERDPAATLADMFRGVETDLFSALMHQRLRATEIAAEIGVETTEFGSVFGPVVNAMLIEAGVDFGTATGRFEILTAGPTDGLSALIIYGDRKDTIRLVFEADPTVIDPATLQTLADGCAAFAVRVLHGLVEDPQQRFAGFTPLTSADRRRVLEDWNRTGQELPASTLPGLVARSLAADPDAPAVSSGDRTLSYQQLAEAANRLARVLIERGVGPDTFVAVALPRSTELVVALLAILEAGGAYVPVDPAYPVERIAFMLADAAPLLVLSDAGTASTLEPARTAVDWLLLDDPALAADLAQRPDAPVTDRIASSLPDHAAYMIYTSGSTGKPKGVVITHRGIVNNLEWARNTLGPGFFRRSLAATSISFDMSSFEIWGTLGAGGSARIVTNVLALGDGSLSGEHFSFVDAVPSVFARVLGDGIRVGGIENFVFAGEALPRSLSTEVLCRFPGTRIVDAYGPTEAFIDTAAITTEVDGAAQGIGRPVWNTRVYVLDRWLCPVAPGVIGELYIGGAQVARGYHGRPALTAGRFVADPLGAAGERLYRTGDLVRWTAGGTLEYAGRADDQVKIRGFRVELGEVESALVDVSGARRAVAVTRADHAGAQQLVGYLWAEAAVGAAQVRHDLGALLPAHMVPAVVVVLDQLPLTPNGKIDRKALPAPEFTRLVSARGPRDGREEVLCGLFAEVLGLDRVGIDDSFFDLGGHSLLGARLLSRVRDVLGADLSVRDLFEAPTAGQLAARAAAAAGSARPPLVARERPEMLPLSFGQARLWFLNRFEAGSANYNLPVVLRLRGGIDPAVLDDALWDVVCRHEPLRTVFPEVDGAAVQRVLTPEQARARWSVTRLSGGSNEAALGEFGRRGFDLSGELPVRAGVLVVGEGEIVLATVFHHIAADGWSLAPFARDLSRAVAARDAGRAPEWAPLPIQYADFALWQRDYLGDYAAGTGKLAEQLNYWRKTLAGAPAELAVPSDRPRPAAPTYLGGAVPIELSAAAHRGVTAVARSCGASVFMVLHAAVSVLLSKLGAGTDIVVGTPVAGRSDAVLDEMVGFFLNTVVLRLDVSDDPSFAAMVARARAVDLGAFEHQDVPFEVLVEAVNPERALNRHPLFQVLVVLQNTELPVIEIPGVDVAVEPVRTESTKVDLEFDFTERGDGEGITGTLRYSADLFDGHSAHTLVRRFTTLLESLVAQPDRRVSVHSLLSTAERARILTDWQSPARPLSAATLPELFEDRAARTPAAPAVVFGGQEMTFGELDAAANRLARHLLARGIGPESTVALLLPRGPELVVALLAVLKSGAAYVPVDPGYPAERIAFMIDDSAARLVLTDSATAADVAVGADRLMLDDPDTAGRIAALSSGKVAGGPAAANPAYVIYTSGSTGTPKGVIVSHEALVNFLVRMADSLSLTPQDRWLAVTTISFDIAALELYLPLITGAAVVVASDLSAKDATALAAAARTAEATVLQATPSMWSSLLAVDPEAVTGLRALVGGEALPTALARSLVATTTSVRNLYGPTEATVWCSQAEVDLDWLDAPTVGVPFADTRAYVLDAALGLVPPGVPGELYVGGVQLARGYHRQPALTAARFVADPYGRPGERLYRTGDVVRWSPAGELEYVGRADDQVKIRGHRIEPGEVEAVIAQVAGVARAVVVARRDRSGAHQLVAYVVPEPGATLSGPAVRAAAAATLPVQLVPAVVVVLAELPLTPNGKVDRKALPAPDFTELVSSRAPRDHREQVLCTVFAEVLELERVGIDDSFFDLGGHSLLGTRLLSRVRTVLGAELTVRDLFEAPTVAALSERVKSASVPAHPALVASVRPDALPLSFGQARLWFLNRFEGASASYNMPMVLRVHGVDRVVLEAALDDVVERHEALRTVFPEVDGTAVQRVLTPEEARSRREFTYRRTDSAQAYAAVAELIGRGFDVTRELPMRVGIFEVGDELLVAIVLHHIAADGWSMAPLARDVTAAVTARLSGDARRWPALPVQYADYALWQRDRLGAAADENSVLARQLAYWRHAIDGAPAELSLPTDRTRPAQPSYRGGSVPIEISAGTHRAVHALARSGAASAFMVLHAAVSVLLAKHGAGTDIVVGTPVAGRADQALEDLVGFFVNTMALRADLSGDPGFAEVVDRVRTADLAAYEHQDLPFELLVEAVSPERALSRHPLFQVLVVVQNDAGPDVVLPGARITVEQVETGATKFDLEFVFTERHDADGAAGITGALHFSRDLFDEATAAQLARRFERLLDQLSARPELPLSQLSVLEPAELERICHTWNDTEHAVAPTTVPELFAAQAHREPTAVAVRDQHGSIAYGEMSAAVNRLARLLTDHGAGPESFVALVLPRSTDLVVGMLAVMTVGAAYVPIDPTYPAARVRYMLSDAGPQVVVTTGATATLVRAADPGAEPIVLDEPVTRAALAAQPSAEVTAARDLDTPAYMIYTSGSTGRPKGVVVTHRSLVNLALTQADSFDIGQGSRIVNVLSPGFDVFTGIAASALVRGATLCPVDIQDYQGDLGRVAVELEPTHVVATPGILELAGEELYDASRTIIVGGEAPSRELVARRDRVRVFNAYGPTECTVMVTASGAGDRTTVIGAPVWNTRVYVLDDALRPVPAGVTGELYVGGVQLARGYHRAAGLTATRFVADPFGTPGQRLYRTGDHVRWTASGELDFLGRADDQVKVRGFRVELGEIEAAVGARPAVAQAAVVVRADRAGRDQLVAYVVAVPGASVDNLRNELRASLPAHMVPLVVATDALPLTPNGKVDRKALPATDFAALVSARGPRTETETALCALFAEVLELERVGIDDSFFDLGGHSLSATRLVSRVRTVLGAELTIRDLFEAPTVESLAGRVRTTARSVRPALRRMR